MGINLLPPPEFPKEYYPIPGVTVRIDAPLPVDDEVLVISVAEVLLRQMGPKRQARIVEYLTKRYQNPTDI